jgi:O-6-methylguanine DNA methyltransferase
MKRCCASQILTVATPDGVFLAAYSERGLCGLSFPRKSAAAPQKAAGDNVAASVRQWHARTTVALLNALAAKPTGPQPPLDLSAGTEFQQKVWNALSAIPTGWTCSYGDVARAIGHDKAVRAVGGACGANPIPVLIPCHRVLAAGGKIGGFSGGLDWKRKLLARENAALPPQP